MPSKSKFDLNKPVISKTAQNFEIIFSGIDTDLAKILSRSAKFVERPIINFNVQETFQKGNVTGKNFTAVTYDTIAITFDDDDAGLTAAAIYKQVLRQTGVVTGTYAGDNGKFSAKIRMFSNAKEKFSEEYVLKNAFFQSVSHNQLTPQSTEPCEIFVSINYDNISINFDNGETIGLPSC